MPAHGRSAQNNLEQATQRSARRWIDGYNSRRSRSVVLENTQDIRSNYCMIAVHVWRNGVHAYTCRRCYVVASTRTLRRICEELGLTVVLEFDADIDSSRETRNYFRATSETPSCVSRSITLRYHASARRSCSVACPCLSSQQRSCSRSRMRASSVASNPYTHPSTRALCPHPYRLFAISSECRT